MTVIISILLLYVSLSPFLYVDIWLFFPLSFNIVNLQEMTKLFESVLFIYLFFIFFLFVVNFVIHWNETAMGLHVFPIPIPPPTSLSTHVP